MCEFPNKMSKVSPRCSAKQAYSYIQTYTVNKIHAQVIIHIKIFYYAKYNIELILISK